MGNPLYKTPRAVCQLNADYDTIDLTAIPDDFLPRTNYVRACDWNVYRDRMPKVPWNHSPVADFYRYANREMVSPNRERTLLTTIVPTGTAFIHTVFGIAFADTRHLVDLVSKSVTIPFDFRVKVTGQGHANYNMLSQFPIGSNSDQRAAAAAVRTLSLYSLTKHYAALWNERFLPSFQSDAWTKPTDSILNHEFFAQLTPEWQRHCPLRTDYERRQALVELDVLAAMELGVTLDELISIYRVQFSVLRQYESETYYDRSGRIVFTPSKGLTDVGFPRKAKPKHGEPTGWEDIREMEHGTVTRTITDDTMPAGPIERTITYTAPWHLPDREDDYRTALKAFLERGITPREVE